MPKIVCALSLLLLASVCSLAASAAEQAELVVQTGHPSIVYHTDISPDGKLLATGAEDNQVKLWEIASGRELRTFYNQTRVAFSPDGRSLVTASQTEIKIWEIATGRKLRTVTGLSGDVASIAVGGGGRVLANGTTSGAIDVWDPATGKKRLTISAHSIPGDTILSAVRSLAVSADGRTIASAAGHGKAAVLWNAANGERIGQLDHPDEVFAVDLSEDGRTLATSCQDLAIRVWDLRSTAVTRTLQGHNDYVRTVSLSPDASRLVTGASNNVIKVWDLKAGSEIRSLSVTNTVMSVSISPDGGTFAGALGNWLVLLWDIQGDREIHTLARRAASVKSVDVSPDGKVLATGDARGKVRLWSLDDGATMRVLDGDRFGIAHLAFSPDGKGLAGFATFGSHFKVWDTETGKELANIDAGQKSVKSIAWNSDGRGLVTGGLDGTVKLWGGRGGPRVLETGDRYASVYAVAMSPDSRLIAAGTTRGKIYLWDSENLATPRVIDAPGSFVYDLAFTPDGGRIACSAANGTVSVWDLASGAAVWTAKASEQPIASLAFTPDGRQLSSAGWDGAVRVWDAAMGAPIHTLERHTDNVYAVAYTPDGRTLFSSGFDATVRMWDAATGAELATLVTIDEADWLVATPDGLFDGAPSAWERMLWRFGGRTLDVAPLEAFFNEYFYPSLLPDLLAGKRPQPPANVATKDRRQPEVSLALVSGDAGAPIAERTVTVRIGIDQAPAGARDVRLFRNGSLVKVWRGDVLKGKKQATLEASIPIVAGENRLMAYAFNRDDIKSTNAQIMIEGAASLARKGTAYVIAVGVNDYSNDAFDLRYAVPDANLFGEEMRKRQAAVANVGRVEVVTLLDAEATKANILAALSRLSGGEVPAGAPDSLRRLEPAQPEDFVAVYFSGHGMAEDDRFYLIPHDMGYTGSRRISREGVARIVSSGISDRELEGAFEGIDAGSSLFVVDACNSGQALEAAERRRGPMNSKGLAQLAYEKGLYVLTAAESYQVAVAPAKLGHGYLTYALVGEGLQKAMADRSPRDGRVMVREWLDYATERVPRMQEEGAREQRILVQEDDADGKPAEPPPPQQPRVFYRREMEERPVVVARVGP